MSAVDINGNVLSAGDNVLVLFGTIGRLDTTDNRAYLVLPDGTTLYVDTEQLEKIASASIGDEIAAVVTTETVGFVQETRAINTTLPLTGGGDLSLDRTLAINNFTGDAGAGGLKGTVPAPAAGDAAALKFLKADGTWAVTPAGAGGGIPLDDVLAVHVLL